MKIHGLFVVIPLILSFFGLASPSLAEINPSRPFPAESWQQYINRIKIEKERSETKGLSYIVSGTMELIGGLLAETTTIDPIEKGVYVLFESIGIASIGYGSYQYGVASQEEVLMESLKATPNINDQTRLKIIKNYFDTTDLNKKREDRIRALTHGLIALLNFYNGSQQKSEPVRNTIYFIGGINLLACISYSF